MQMAWSLTHIMLGSVTTHSNQVLDMDLDGLGEGPLLEGVNVKRIAQVGLWPQGKSLSYRKVG